MSPLEDEVSHPGDMTSQMTTLPFGFSGTMLPSVDWAGTRFNAVIDPDWNEIERRDELGLGAVTDLRLLQAISTLPHGFQIAWEEIDPVTRAILDCAHQGVLCSTSMGVTTELRPPLRLVGVFCVSRHWRAIDRVGVMASTAACGVVVRHQPRGLEEATHRARKFGLGLAVVKNDQHQLLVTPASRPRPSLIRTMFLEVLYRLWRQRTLAPKTSDQASSCLGGASGR